MNSYDINKEIDEIYEDKRKQKVILYILCLSTLVLLGVTPPLAAFGMIAHESLLTLASAGLLFSNLAMVVLQKLYIKEYDKLIEEVKQEKSPFTNDIVTDNDMEALKNLDSLLATLEKQNQKSSKDVKQPVKPISKVQNNDLNIEKVKPIEKVENINSKKEENKIIQPKFENIQSEKVMEKTTLNNDEISYTAEQAIKELEELKLEFLNDFTEDLGYVKTYK